MHIGYVRSEVECKREGGEKERPGDEGEEACWDEWAEGRERSVEALDKVNVSSEHERMERTRTCICA